MRRLLIFIVLYVSANISFGQIIEIDKEINAVFQYLGKEDYISAFNRTDKLLEETVNDSGEIRGIILYMHIFSAAGLVSQDKMKHGKFLDHVNKYIGQRIFTPAYPCVDSGSIMFNSLEFITKDGKRIGKVTSSNPAATSIFAFEEYRLLGSVNVNDYLGKYVSCGGVLESVQTNPNESTIWISRIYIGGAYARVIKTD